MKSGSQPEPIRLQRCERNNPEEYCIARNPITFRIYIPIGKEKEVRDFYTDVLGLTEIVNPEPVIPNGGIYYQPAYIQLQMGAENEDNTSIRHPHLRFQI
jgi:hypothetical protein